ncbi:WxcM-like domain-containing protein [candidate division KSB1 bacterium]|nr:WxcM-like domain-containing protein [candidate division KSB1 bacterium]
MSSITIHHLDNLGDQRGVMHRVDQSSLDFLDPCREMHSGTIEPGAIRGNHYHTDRKELLIIIHSDEFQFAWQEKGQADIQIETFTGSGAVTIEISPGAIHAIKNTGQKSMTLIACSDGEFDPEYKDTIRRTILS